MGLRLAAAAAGAWLVSCSWVAERQRPIFLQQKDEITYEQMPANEVLTGREREMTERGGEKWTLNRLMNAREECVRVCILSFCSSASELVLCHQGNRQLLAGYPEVEKTIQPLLLTPLFHLSPSKRFVFLWYPCDTPSFFFFFFRGRVELK